MRLHTLVVALLVGVCTLGANCDPGCRITVVVRVVDTSERPIEGATVLATDGDCCNDKGGHPCTLTTGSDGTATYDQMSVLGTAPDCTLRVEKSGFRTHVDTHNFRCAEDEDAKREARVVLEPEG